MTDLIIRLDAIEAIAVLRQEHGYKIPGKRETYSQYNEAWQDALDRAEGAIFNLPPDLRWAPVSDGLPGPRHAVLVWCPERKNVFCAYTEDGKWLIYGSHGVVLEEAVEAWMYAPIPERS